ncbi:MAG: flippase-like domain-containing protein [Deltaproteobacteria bacterium]|nr:flippase-like domain-containing protein [Deltaproteobacteria bacterium]
MVINLKSVKETSLKVVSHLYFRLAFTALLLWYIYRQIDVNLLMDALWKVNYAYLPWTVLIILGYWALNVTSLYFLLLPIGRVNFSEFFKHQLESIILGSVTPMQLGEAAIFVYLKRINFPLQKTLSAFFFNKVSHYLMMLLSGFLFLYYVKFNYSSLLFGSLVALILLVPIVVGTGLRTIIRDLVVKKYLFRYYAFFELTSDYLRKHRGCLLLNGLFNFLKIIDCGLEIWLILLIFNVHGNFLLFLSVYNLCRILALVPVSISGLGVLEGGAALALSRLGYEYSAVILAMFFLRVVALLMSAFFLSFCLLQRRMATNEIGA